MKEFNFKNNLVPNLKKPINKKIKAMYFGEHKIDGFVINNYTGLMQFIEFLTALKKTANADFNKTYKFSNFAPLTNSVYQLTLENTKNANDKLNFAYIQLELIVPSIDDIIDYNSRAQDIYSEKGVYGKFGIKDEGLVINILSKVEHSIFFDEDQYPTIASKAAYLWTKLAGYQTFQNGNKRTAMVSTLIFLHSNGYDFQYKDNMLQELVTVSTRLATKELSEDDLTNYILKNIKINYKNEEWNTLERLKSEKFK